MRYGWLILGLVACTGGPAGAPAQKSGPPTVQTLSYPAWYLVHRVGGGRVEAQRLLPVGEDAATWAPGGDAVGGLASVDLIVMNGAGYEGWVKTASLPSDKVVNTAKGLKLVEVEGPTHSHGADGAHSHHEVDPRVWTDPARYQQQADAVRNVLVTADPAGKIVYDGQYDGFSGQLTELATELDGALARLKDVPLASDGTAFRYWADRAGRPIAELSLDPATPPSAERLAEITAAMPEGGVLLWAAQPSDEVQAALPSFQHLRVDPLDGPRTDGSYDYIAQMRVNVALLGKVKLPEGGTDAGGTDAD